jgi:hypothetical protein
VLAPVYAHYYFPLTVTASRRSASWLDASGQNRTPRTAQYRVAATGGRWPRKSTGRQRRLRTSVKTGEALRTLIGFLRDVTASAREGPPLVHVEELDRLVYKPKWGKVHFANEDFSAINGCSYFDCQQKRVFVRTNKET